MKRLFENPRFQYAFSLLKPWLIVGVIFIFLRMTGLLSGVSYVAQSALMKTGIMNAEPESIKASGESFDYDFTLQDLDGKPLQVASLKGKVLFINLWATWCGPCRAEMSSIQSLYDKMDHEKVIFVMISLDKAGPQKVKEYIAKKEFSFPVYMASDGMPELLDVPSIPSTFIIGKDGKVKSKKVGAANYDSKKFIAHLNSLANE